MNCTSVMCIGTLKVINYGVLIFFLFSGQLKMFLSCRGLRICLHIYRCVEWTQGLLIMLNIICNFPLTHLSKATRMDGRTTNGVGGRVNVVNVLANICTHYTNERTQYMHQASKTLFTCPFTYTFSNVLNKLFIMTPISINLAISINIYYSK